MSSNSDIDVALVAGFGAGLYLFFKGFRVFREYRVLADTPEMPIRSIPMGLVEIHGKARGEKLATSPVTKTPCLFYKVDVERWVKDKNGGHWAHAATDADGVKFYLDDATGKVLVDAHGAEYDLLRSARIETGRVFGGRGRSSLWRKRDVPSNADIMASDSELASYAQSVIGNQGLSHSLGGSNLLSTLAGGSLGMRVSPSNRYRLSEYLILPDHWYDVTGTCRENPLRHDEEDRNMIVKGQNEPTFLISWQSEKGIEGTLRKRAALYVFGGAGLSVVCLGILLMKFGWL
jgi:hypothetical protein